MRAGVAGSLIGLAAIVAGCGSSPQPASAPAPVRGDLARIAFDAPASELRTLAAARDRLIARCMAARGFTFPARATTPRFERALMGSTRQTGRLKLPSGTVVTYPAHGCYPQAMSRLYGSMRRYQWFIARRNEVRTVSGTMLSRDRRLARARTGWTRCMAERGFRDAAPEVVAESGGRRLIAADRACRAATNLRAESARAERAVLRALPRAERAAAAELAPVYAGAVERARRIVGAD